MLVVRIQTAAESLGCSQPKRPKPGSNAALLLLLGGPFEFGLFGGVDLHPESASADFGGILERRPAPLRHAIDDSHVSQSRAKKRFGKEKKLTTIVDNGEYVVNI